jgi:hypothetical protein
MTRLGPRRAQVYLAHHCIFYARLERSRKSADLATRLRPLGFREGKHLTGVGLNDLTERHAVRQGQHSTML